MERIIISRCWVKKINLQITAAPLWQRCKPRGTGNQTGSSLYCTRTCSVRSYLSFSSVNLVLLCIIHNAVVNNICFRVKTSKDTLGGSARGRLLLICFLLSLHLRPLQNYVIYNILKTCQTHVLLTIQEPPFLLSLPFCFLDVCLCVRNYLSPTRP